VKTYLEPFHNNNKARLEVKTYLEPFHNNN